MLWYMKLFCFPSKGNILCSRKLHFWVLNSLGKTGYYFSQHLALRLKCIYFNISILFNSKCHPHSLRSVCLLRVLVRRTFVICFPMLSSSLLVLCFWPWGVENGKVELKCNNMCPTWVGSACFLLVGIFTSSSTSRGLPWWLSSKNLPEMSRDVFNPWVRKIPWRKKWQPTPVSCLGNPMDREAWRATVGGVAKESNTT